MSSINLLIYTLFNHIFHLSLLASIILPFVLLIKRLFKNIAGVHFQYIVWLILILRLLLPVAPESFLSIYNYIPIVNHITYINAIYSPINNDISNNLSNSNTNDINSVNNTYSSNSDTNVAALSYSEVGSIINGIKTLMLNKYKIFSLIWVLGVLLLSSIFILFNVRFRHKVKKCSTISDSKLLNEFYKCKAIVGLKRNVPLILTDYVKNPAVVGVLYPKILLPESKLQLLSKEELCFIFLHELSHIKRKDTFINYVMTFITLIYWFNPLIWYSFRRMKDDMELSCDSSALRHISDIEITKYGSTIIKLAQISDRGSLMTGMASIVNKKSKVKRRLVMLNRYKRKPYRLTVIAIIALIAFGTASLTGAKTFSSNSVEAPKESTNTSHMIIDKIDYPFINDSQIIGKWDVVDFVNEINDFKPGAFYKGEKYSLKSITFAEIGKMAIPIMEGSTFNDEVLSPSVNWTKGYIIDKLDKTASIYTIKTMAGNQYMFMEWKSGDYSSFGMKPSYYVLKKTSSEAVTLKNREENINYKFVNDNQAIGTWQSVDYVNDINSFDPQSKNLNEGQLFLKKLFIYKGGLVGEPDYSTISSNGKTISSTSKWTKGYTVSLITGKKTHYMIKIISGVKYMFYEWNIGYYVLKRIN